MSNIYADVARKFVEVVKKYRSEQKIDISEDNINYDEFESDPIRIFISHAQDDFALRLRFDIVNEDDIKYIRVEVSSGAYDHYEHIMRKRKFITRLRYELDDVMEDSLMNVLVVTINAICMDRYQEYLKNPKHTRTELAGDDTDINPWMF
jgi:hypothetical protein